MSKAIIGLCTLQFYIPGVTSLKEKRGILKSMINRLDNKFNVSIAEIDHQDKWQSAIVAFVCVSNSTVQVQKTINNAINWIEAFNPDLVITHQDIEIL